MMKSAFEKRRRRKAGKGPKAGKVVFPPPPCVPAPPSPPPPPSPPKSGCDVGTGLGARKKILRRFP